MTFEGSKVTCHVHGSLVPRKLVLGRSENKTSMLKGVRSKARASETMQWKMLAVLLLGSNFTTAIFFVYYYSYYPHTLKTPVISRDCNSSCSNTVSSNLTKSSTISSLTCDCNGKNQSSQSFINQFKSGWTLTNTSRKTIYVITPTHKRTVQKVDLTSMCHTLMHVPDLVWIVIEDAPEPTDLVKRLLQRCRVRTVHLFVPTRAEYILQEGKPTWSKPRGVDQRNAGLDWLRKHFSISNCSGVFYFGDDDNKYDLRLFDEIRQTEVVSVLKVAWVSALDFEGPLCVSGRAVSWRGNWAPERELPNDMAGFAGHLCQLFIHPKARIGVDIHGKESRLGYLETDFFQQFANRSQVECRGSETETYVWHSHTEVPTLPKETKIAIET